MAMTPSQKKQEAAQARRASRTLLAESRAHERKAAEYRRLATRELERAKHLDRQAADLARKEKAAARKKPASPRKKASAPRGKVLSVWIGNGGWHRQAEVQGLAMARAMATRLRREIGHGAQGVVIRPAAEGAPPWPPPPSSRGVKVR